MSKLTGIALVIYMPLTFYAEEFNFKHGVRRRAPAPVPQTPTMRTSLSVVPARVALCRGDLAHGLRTRPLHPVRARTRTPPYTSAH